MQTSAPIWTLFITLIACFGQISHAAVDATKAARALETYNANTPPDRVASLFNDFCRSHFGAKHEPLAYDLFGKDLTWLPKGEWTYPSVNSATIASETNLPATTYVEYGTTTAYGKRTQVSERPFYIHVHYLRDLKPGTTYHYRIVGTDERGNRVEGAPMTITTKSLDGVIPFPSKQTKLPYKLDKANVTYVLTQDIVADKTAIEIHAPGITLDLNGHTITYANTTTDKAVFTDKWMAYTHKGSFGIKNIGHSDVKILNGTILQGKGDNRGNSESTGFNPIYLRGLSNITIAGVTIDYWTPQIVGIRARKCEGTFLMHHTVLQDRGTKMQNRHGSGCASASAIACKFTDDRMHHCLVKRTRQNGLRPSTTLYNSEIYVDSWATNSFAAGSKHSHNNRIFATGYHAISLPWGNGIKVHDNFIHMEGINTGRTRWWESFGDQNSMNGLRHTQWGKNRTVSNDSQYYNNTVVINAQNGAQVRGVEFFSDPYIRNLVMRDSTIKVITKDKQTDKVTCLATHGSGGRHDMHLPVTYRNCRFISNINLLRLGDDYGRGDNHIFENCTFERVGNDSRFSTVEGMSTYFSQHHLIRDSEFVNCKPDDFTWKQKTGPRDYQIQHSLTIQGEKGTAFSITDKTGKPCFTGTMGEASDITLPLSAYLMSNKTPTKKTLLTPHTISVKLPNGKTLTHTVDMNTKQSISLTEGKMKADSGPTITLYIHPNTPFTLKDKGGNVLISGNMNHSRSIAIALPEDQAPYSLSGIHVDKESFKATITPSSGTYTLAHSAKSMKALVARESKKKKK